MIPLIKLREDIRFAQDLREMIEVLKGATASRFRALQRKEKGFDQFKTRMEEFLSAVDVAGAPHPFLKKRASVPKAIVMITSDEGFLGNLNIMVVQAGLEQAASQDELIVLGERGARHLSEIQSAAFTVLPGISDDITYGRAVAVRDLLINKFLSKKAGSVLVAYPRFVSLTIQTVEVATLLPCVEIFDQKKDSRKQPALLQEVLLEPSRGKIVDFLVRAWMMQRLYDIFWESKLAECAARIIHLEGSHEEILSVNKKLLYEYFKRFHEKSDKDIREIFASRLH